MDSAPRLQLGDGVDLPTSAPPRKRTQAARKKPRSKTNSKSKGKRSNKDARPRPGRTQTQAASRSSGNPAADVLPLTLRLAVPLNIMKMRDWSPERRCEVGRAQATTVASHGDDLMYGGKHCADAFNALAMGLAALAYQPGGARFLDLHWCVDAHPGCPNRPGGESSEETGAIPDDEAPRQP
jgi:hypothetical protein